MEKQIIEILNFYGEDNQANQLVQEASELVVAITKNDIKNIMEEIADTEIMVTQFLNFKAVNKQAFYEFFKFSERKLLIDPLFIEDNLKLTLLKLCQSIIQKDLETSVLITAELEVILKSYKKIKCLDSEEISEIISQKVERQLKRIENEK